MIISINTGKTNNNDNNNNNNDDDDDDDDDDDEDKRDRAVGAFGALTLGRYSFEWNGSFKKKKDADQIDDKCACLKVGAH